MLISIVTITLNNLSGLRKTVDSVVNQKYFDSIEYIVVDGGSIDGTKQYLEKLPTKITWVSEKDKGISDAFNKGILLSKGNIILMLNAGDYFVGPDSLSRVADDWASSNTDILSYEIRNADGLKKDSVKRNSTEWCEIPHQSTFVARRVYETVGYYSQEYHIRMDFHFFARCKNAGMRFLNIPVPLVVYEGNGISTLKDYRHRNWREALSVKLLYGIPLSCKDVMKMVIIKIMKTREKI